MLNIVDKFPYYLQLMRFEKPIGSLLLLWPTLWACWVASDGRPDGLLVWVFVAGVLVMRSAGCVINDLADRKIDPLVKRTEQRPLAAGKVTTAEAFTLFGALISVAIGLLALLPSRVWLWAIPAAVLTVIYPFMKRFFQAPQLVLGVAFSFSIPMVYVAFGHKFDQVFWLLILANIAWVVAYDSAYAMSDREDDLKIGVRSTAILFGRFDRLVILLLQFLVIGLLIFTGFKLQLTHSYYLGLLIATGLFLYQQWLIKGRDRHDCFRAFLNNGWLGAFVWFGFVLGFQ